MYYLNIYVLYWKFLVKLHILRFYILNGHCEATRQPALGPKIGRQKKTNRYWHDNCNTIIFNLFKVLAVSAVLI